MEWKSKFASRIIQRGYEYYYGKLVRGFECNEQKIRANVCGSDIYNVVIEMNNNKIIHMECDCPYAMDGHNCKHMAAVLYKYEKEVMIHKDENNDELMLLIEKTDRKILNQFLYQICDEYEWMYDRLKRITEKNIFDLKYYKSTMNYLSDDLNEFEEDEVECFIDQVIMILKRDVKSVIVQEAYEEAFKILKYLYEYVKDMPLWDYEYKIEEMDEMIYQMWCEILTKVSVDQKRRMFEYFVNYAINNNDNIIVEKILEKEFKEKEFIHEKINFIKSKIEAMNREDEGYFARQEKEEYLKQYLELLKEVKDVSEIRKVYRNYWNYSEVRKFFIDTCLNQERYTKAIEILDQSIELDRDDIELVLKYKIMKKDIYLLSCEKQAYLEQLWNLLVDVTPRDLSLYKELKSQFDQEEWITLREEAFKIISKKYSLYEFYLEEVLYDRLLNEVIKANDLMILSKYEKHLIALYPKEILKQYEKILNEMVKEVSDRSTYAHIASILKHMTQIEDGKELVNLIIDEWKIKYKTRRALHDEIRKAMYRNWY